jgi:RNA polymerase sigma-70 factor (ECF subfamily)
MLGDRHEAEDVAQEVFVRALRSLASWDQQRPLKPWLITIAANRCRTALGRRKTRPESVPFDLDVADRSRPADGVNELQAEVQGALGELREDYRQAFLLYHERGLSYAEMSELTGKPVGTLKTWLFRARQEMLARLKSRGMIDEEFAGDLPDVRSGT